MFLFQREFILFNPMFLFQREFIHTNNSAQPYVFIPKGIYLNTNIFQFFFHPMFQNIERNENYLFLSEKVIPGEANMAKHCILKNI